MSAAPSRLMLLVGLLAACVSLAAQGALYDGLEPDPDHVVRLRRGEQWPARLAEVTELTSLVDRAIIREGFRPQVAMDLEVGAYRYSRYTVFIRAGDAALDHLASFRGLPVAESDDPAALATEARAARSCSRFSSLIHAWRLGDDIPWPWVAHGRSLGGLASLVAKVNPTTHGFTYDPAHGCYCDAEGEPLVIVGPENAQGGAIRPGTIVSSGAGRVRAVLGTLWHDEGRPGLLDPGDVVLTTQHSDGGPASRLHATKLGLLVGREPIHCSNRDPERARAQLARNLPEESAAEGEAEAEGIPASRQLMLVAGMVILILTLLRWIRLQRKRNRRRENQMQQQRQRILDAAREAREEGRPHRDEAAGNGPASG